MRILSLLPALAALSAAPALAQGFGTDVDETAGGGMEEAAALYFAAPPTEKAEAVVTQERLADAGTVQLAIALGQVEEGLGACQALRREMQMLIGDSYGSYSVNPGWLRRYQACVLRRAEETKMIGDAIKARQTELISRIGETEDEAESGEDSMRAADLMARLAVRQSAVRRAVGKEGRLQRDFVRYYNTGDRPESLDEEEARPQAPEPGGEPLLDGQAPGTGEPALVDEPLPSDMPMGGAILREGEEVEGAVPADRPVPGATGEPVPLNGPDPAPAEDDRDY